MKPLVEGLEKQYSGSVEFHRYNVESDQSAIALADKLGVQYVPTFVFATKDGVISKTVVGEMTKEALDTSVKAILQ